MVWVNDIMEPSNLIWFLTSMYQIMASQSDSMSKWFSTFFTFNTACHQYVSVHGFSEWFYEQMILNIIHI